jgi:hypothetical protein
LDLSKSIIGRNNCIYMTLRFCYSIHLRAFCTGWNTGLSAKQNNKYQLLHKYSCPFYLIFMDPCIVVWISRNNIKMQPCNRIYYFKDNWRLKMIRAAHRSSSGALYYIFWLWFTWYFLRRHDFTSSILLHRKKYYINQRLQIQFRATDDEWCAARNMLRLQ